MRFIALFFAFFLIVPIARAQEMHCPHTDQTRLDISAQSDVKATPDIAIISSGVLTIAKTANQAMKDNADKMNAVFDAVKKAGIAEKDIQTSGFSLNPQYVYQDNQAPRIQNYQASNMVTIRIRDMKAIGAVMDALIAQGSNQLNGPTFSVEHPDQFMNEARKDAVKKATEKATLYASAVGMKIKRIVNVSEQAGYNTPPVMPMMARAKMMDMAEASAPTPVAAGEVEMSVTVNIAYELE